MIGPQWSQDELTGSSIENEDEIRKQLILTAYERDNFLLLLNELPIRIWRVNEQGDVDFFNQTLIEKAFNLNNEFSIDNWISNIHKEDADEVLKAYKKAFNNREVIEYKFRTFDANGAIIWLKDFAKPVYVDGYFKGYLGCSFDITDLINYQQKLVELNETKEKLISIISHDLRAPFVTLQQYTDLILEDVNNNTSVNELVNNIKIINKKITEASDLINDLLTWTLVQRDKLQFKPTLINLTQLIDEKLSLFIGIAANKNIVIKKQIDAEILLKSDENMVLTVLRNLISNAIKFSEPNKQITISAFIDGLKATICVKDEGVGLNEEKIKNIFINPLKSTKGTAGETGNGLGLMICKELIDKCGGEIWVNSELNKGSNFCFSLPLYAKNKS